MSMFHLGKVVSVFGFFRFLLSIFLHASKPIGQSSVLNDPRKRHIPTTSNKGRQLWEKPLPLLAYETNFVEFPVLYIFNSLALCSLSRLSVPCDLLMCRENPSRRQRQQQSILVISLYELEVCLDLWSREYIMMDFCIWKLLHAPQVCDRNVFFAQNFLIILLSAEDTVPGLWSTSCLLWFWLWIFRKWSVTFITQVSENGGNSKVWISKVKQLLFWYNLLQLAFVLFKWGGYTHDSSRWDWYTSVF